MHELAAGSCIRGILRGRPAARRRDSSAWQRASCFILPSPGLGREPRGEGDCARHLPIVARANLVSKERRALGDSAQCPSLFPAAIGLLPNRQVTGTLYQGETGAEQPAHHKKRTPACIMLRWRLEGIQSRQGRTTSNV